MGYEPRFDIMHQLSEENAEEFSEELGTPTWPTWQEWLSEVYGSMMLCEVDTTYIEDAFNLYGLRHLFPNFEECLELILDEACLEDSKDPVLTGDALLLYGLIHSRFIITNRGLDAMLKKYKSADFGHCPRVGCRGQPVLPYGRADEMRKYDVETYCPKCNDVYTLPKLPKYQTTNTIDGSCIGTTFTYLFTMTFDKIMPKCSRGTIVPRVFGFKIHSSAQCMQRLKGLNSLASSSLHQRNSSSLTGAKEKQSETGEGAEAQGSTTKAGKGRVLEMACKGSSYANTRSRSIANSGGGSNGCSKRAPPPSSNCGVDDPCNMGAKRLASY